MPAETRTNNGAHENGVSTAMLPCLPEGNTTDRAVVVVVFVLSLAYLCLFRRFTTMEPDEGIILQGAQRILHGEVLYRDFFSFLTPGSYYFLALLFKVFGSSLLVPRTALVIFGGICSAVTYLLARRVCSRRTALFAAGLVTMTALPYRFLVLHNWDSTLLTCLAVYCAVRLLESPGWRWAFGAGSFASLTVLFEQSKGAGLILGIVAGLAAIWFADRQRLLLRRTQPAAIALGLGWPWLVTLGYFGARNCLSTMLADWLWPLHHYSLPNRVPYGYQGWSDTTFHALFGSGPVLARLFYTLTLSPGFLIPALPLIAVALFVYWTIQMRRQAGSPAKCAYYALMTGTISGLLVSIVLVRADIIHFVYLLPLFSLVLAWGLDGRDIPGRLFKVVRPFLYVYVAIAFVAFWMPLLMRAARAPYSLSTRRGVVTMSGKDTVVEYVQAHVVAGDTILVYPYLPLYYYLTGTFSPSRYEYFQPGMNTGDQALEMLSQVASRRVRAVVFEASFAQKIPTAWPGTPIRAIADDPVADYIVREYRACETLRSPAGWRFLFMIRKDLSCP